MPQELFSANSKASWNTAAYAAELQQFLTPAQITPMITQYERLLDTLNCVEDDILFISIGCYNNNWPEQQLPTYLKKIAETKKTQALLIDGLFDDKAVQRCVSWFEAEKIDPHEEYYRLNGLHLNLKIFHCYLDEKGLFHDQLKKAIVSVIDRDGRVFIANHVHGYSFADIPEVAEVCNAIKRENPKAHQALQLYTQCGMGKVRYSLDKPSNYKIENRVRADQLESFFPVDDEFYVCDKLTDLQDIDEFKPAFQPTSLLQIEKKQNASLIEEQLSDASPLYPS